MPHVENPVCPFTQGWSITSEPLRSAEVKRTQGYACLRVDVKLQGCTPNAVYTAGLNVYGADLPVFGGIERLAFDPGTKTIDGVSREQVNEYVLVTRKADEAGYVKFRRILPMRSGTYDTQIWIAKGAVSPSEGSPAVCYKFGETFGDSRKITIVGDSTNFRTPDYTKDDLAYEKAARRALEEQKLAKSLSAGFQSFERLPRDLRNFEARMFSQNGEDGIIQEICRRLKIEHGMFVEFGSGSGRECNCRWLVEREGWRGVFIEASKKKTQKATDRYQDYKDVKCAHAWITSSNIESIFSSLGVHSEFDLLSIDIDGNDYWVWRAIRSYHPIVVVIEYNASYPPPARWVMVENQGHVWDETTYFGASLASLAALGEQKGYRLIGTNSTGVNAFFLREDYFDESLFVAGSVEYHYSRPTYGPFGAGHWHRDGPHLEI